MATTVAELQAKVTADTSQAQSALNAFGETVDSTASGATTSLGGMVDSLKSALSGDSLGGVLNTLMSAMGTAGIVSTLVGLGKMGYELGEVGLKAQATEQAFNTLTGHLGAVPNIFTQMQIAAAGTIGDLQLMNTTTAALTGTSRTFGGAMLDAMPALIEGARALAKMNPELGGTAEMFELLTSGIRENRESTLNNTGLMIDSKKVYEEYGKSIGVAAKELTDEQKATALLGAALDSTRQIIQMFGGDLESALSSAERSALAMAGLRSELGKNFSPFTSGIQEGVAGLATDFTTALQVGSDDTATKLRGLRTQLAGVETEIAGLQATAGQTDIWADFASAPGDEARLQRLIAQAATLKTQIETLQNIITPPPSPGETTAQLVSAAYPMPAYAQPGGPPPQVEVDVVVSEASAADLVKQVNDVLGKGTVGEGLSGAVAKAAPTDVDVTGFVNNMTGAIDSAITASAGSFAAAGKRIWDGIAAGISSGFTSAASNDAPFRAIIKGMVNASVAEMLSD